MAKPARDLLESLYRTAVAAAHPAQCLPPQLPDFPARGRLVVLAAGKGAGSMTEVAERHYLQQMAERGIAEDRLLGVAVTRHGYGRPTRRIDLV
jgi:glycerate 2-kinase